MTMCGAGWGFNLIDLTPVAKLVAIRIGDWSDPDGVGTVAVSRLAEWCCASLDEIFEALVLLNERHGIEWVSRADSIDFVLPIAARPPIREPAPRGNAPASIYVFRGRLGIKIGITTQTVEARRNNIRASTLDDSISIEWSFEGKEGVVRLSEKLAHAKLAAKLIKREWFNVPLDEAIAAVVAAVEEARKVQK